MTGIIKSVQNVTITIATSATTGTVTISSVNTAAAFVTLTGFHGAVSSTVSQGIAGISLTNATTVTATRGSSDASNALVISVCVWEFQTSAIKSIQQQTKALSNVTSGTNTITSVTTGNAFIAWGGWTTSSTSGDWSVWPKAVLTNATTVTVTQGVTAAGIVDTVYYTVVEFNAGVLNSSVQSGIVSIPATTATSGTTTISSVNTSQAVIFGDGWTCASAIALGNYNILPTLALTNSTTVTLSMVSAATKSASLNASFFVVEFKAVDLVSLQNTTVTTGSSSTTGTTTITSVTTTRAAISWLGFTGSTSGFSFSNGNTDLELTNATTLTTTRAVSASGTITTGCVVVEFAPYVPSNGNMFMVF